MIEIFRRCSHCGVRYIYQETGPDCLEELNDGRWCPDCMKVVLGALSKVPVKRKRDIIVTKSIEIYLKHIRQLVLKWKRDYKLLVDSLISSCDIQTTIKN